MCALYLRNIYIPRPTKNQVVLKGKSDTFIILFLFLCLYEVGQ